MSLFDWKQVECENRPSPRSAFAFCQTDDAFYLFAGMGLRRSKDLWKFSFGSQQWEELNTSSNEGGGAPPARSKTTLVPHPNGNYLYLWGGWGEKKYQDLWRLDLGTLHWKKLPQGGTLPAIRSSHYMVYHNNCLILFGGIGANKYNDMYLYSLDGGCWTPIPATNGAPGRRSSYGGLHKYKGNLWVTCGLGCGQFNDTWRFDLTSKTWHKVATSGIPPKNRGRHSCSLYGNKLILFSGTNLRFVWNDIHVLNLDTAAWSKLNTGVSPPKRESGATAIHQNTLYSFYGRSNNGVFFDDTWELDISSLSGDVVLKSSEGEEADELEPEDSVISFDASDDLADVEEDGEK